VSGNALSPDIDCSVSVRNFVVPEDTVPRFESVYLFREGDFGASKEGITGFWKGVRLSIFPTLGIVVSQLSLHHGFDSPPARRLLGDRALLIARSL